MTLLEALAATHEVSWSSGWGGYNHSSTADYWRDFLAVAGPSAEDAVLYRIERLEADEESRVAWDTLINFAKVIRPLKGERIARFFTKNKKSRDELMRRAAANFFADAPELAKASRKSKTEPTAKKSIVEWFKAPGSRFKYEMSDFDANDTYVLGIAKLGKTLSWSWDGAGDQGEVTASADSLENGNQIAFISQGSVMPEEGATPPFLVSRSAANTLRSGKSTSLEVYGAKSDLKKTGIKNIEIDIDGKKTKIAAVHARGDDLEIWFVDDAEWPMLLKAEFQGDNEITLKAVLAAD